MQYRKYGKNGPEVSLLGFGVMRLPSRRKGQWGTVNFTKSKAVMRAAMESGVNFFDSHHKYHGGLSEVAIGRTLKGWKGQRIYTQTKTPIYSGDSLSHYKKLLEEALEKMQVDCIDYLLSHAMDMKNFKKRGKIFFRLTDWALNRGYIRHRGFSSHDTPANVKAFIDTGEFSAMLLSYNWLDTSMAKTIAYGARKGMGVAVMNPVGGGALSLMTPAMKPLLRGAKTAPEIALRFAQATPGVCVTLSGMSTLEQVAENTAIAGRKTPMTKNQWDRMQTQLKALRKQINKLCTGCGYCMPCPHGVDIPANFRAYSQAKLLGIEEHPKRVYEWLRNVKSGDRSAGACKACGKCLPKCPNHIAIIEQLAETAELLG